MADGGPGRIGFTPRVLDGPDRPWTRGRRTRWWLVVPADLAVVGATSLFASAAVHDASRAPGLAAGGAAAIAAGWLAARTVRRRDDHLEAAWPDGALALAVCWAVWTASQWAIAQWAARAAPGAAGVAPGAAGTAPGATGTAGGGPPSVALVLACFLAVLGGGWRRLYGFAKAHDSLVPKGVQRRLDAQADAGLPADAGPSGGDGAGD
ncbi:hypothetical protein [Actinomyces dentalis]|uniref:hypothetical protein n=1 Tax=Actinomyces dentalis TaxID=272548 RepID=UPI000402E9C4|nr:hypothetical protein [Actinomyces dentalis]